MKFLIGCILAINLYSYDLPSFDLESSDKAQIVFLTAQSVLVDEKLSYLVKWKAINATKLEVTYFGEIALSGEATITQDEYKRGVITFVATNSENNSRDSKRLNKALEADRVAPVMKVNVREEDYFEAGIPRTYYRPWNPRNIH